MDAISVAGAVISVVSNVDRLILLLSDPHDNWSMIADIDDEFSEALSLVRFMDMSKDGELGSITAEVAQLSEDIQRQAMQMATRGKILGVPVKVGAARRRRLRIETSAKRLHDQLDRLYLIL